jgi:hypothetical protein
LPHGCEVLPGRQGPRQVRACSLDRRGNGCRSRFDLPWEARDGRRRERPWVPPRGSLASTGLGPTGGCSASPLGHREGIWSGRPPRQLPRGRPDFRCREQTTVSRLAACRPAPARVQTPWAVEVLVLPAAAAASRANAPPFPWSAASQKIATRGSAGSKRIGSTSLTNPPFSRGGRGQSACTGTA